MAEEDRPTSVLDKITRLNLLDIVLERARNFNKKALIQCLIYVGRMNPQRHSPQDLIEHYERMFKNYTGLLQLEPASGLLLLYPNHFVHVLEGPENVLADVMIDLSESKELSSIISETKVLVYINDIPTRLYSQWSSRVLNLASVRMDESKMQESIESIVSEALTLILKLGAELGKYQKIQLKTHLDQLTTKFQNLLLPQDLIESLLKSKKLLTVPDFNKKYSLPPAITLDSELVWPMRNHFPNL